MDLRAGTHPSCWPSSGFGSPWAWLYWCRWGGLLWGWEESWKLLLALLFGARHGPAGQQSLPWLGEEGPATASPGPWCGPSCSP